MSQTPYVETEVLLAVMEERYGDLDRLLTEMSYQELQGFNAQIKSLTYAVNAKIRLRQYQAIIEHTEPV